MALAMAETREDSLHGEIAWISGGAQGIGLELAKLLSGKGCHVALIDMCSEDKGRAAAKACCGKGNAIFLHCDVTDTVALRASLQKAAETFGVRCPSIFVNNAGIVDEERRSLMIDINVKAVIEGCLAQQDLLRLAGKTGVIVNNASLAGVVPTGQTPAYDASKFACVGWTMSFAMKLHALAERGASPQLRVNAVCPHLVDTPTVGSYYKTAWENMGGSWAEMAKHPMSPKVVAHAMLQLIEGDFHGAVALVTPKASWIKSFDAKSVLTPGGIMLARM